MRTVRLYLRSVTFVCCVEISNHTDIFPNWVVFYTLRKYSDIPVTRASNASGIWPKFFDQQHALSSKWYACRYGLVRPTFTTVSCLRRSRPCDKQESPMRDCLCVTRTSTVTALHNGPSLSGAAPRFWKWGGTILRAEREKNFLTPPLFGQCGGQNIA